MKHVKIQWVFVVFFVFIGFVLTIPQSSLASELFQVTEETPDPPKIPPTQIPTVIPSTPVPPSETPPLDETQSAPTDTPPPMEGTSVPETVTPTDTPLGAQVMGQVSGRDECQGLLAIVAVDPSPAQFSTLSGISQHFYGTWRYYPVLATYNNISNPNLIYPGQTIRVPILDSNGEPRGGDPTKCGNQTPPQQCPAETLPTVGVPSFTCAGARAAKQRLDRMIRNENIARANYNNTYGQLVFAVERMEFYWYAGNIRYYRAYARRVGQLRLRLSLQLSVWRSIVELKADAQREFNTANNCREKDIMDAAREFGVDPVLLGMIVEREEDGGTSSDGTEDEPGRIEARSPYFAIWWLGNRTFGAAQVSIDAAKDVRAEYPNRFGQLSGLEDYWLGWQLYSDARLNIRVAAAFLTILKKRVLSGDGNINGINDWNKRWDPCVNITEREIDRLIIGAYNQGWSVVPSRVDALQPVKNGATYSPKDDQYCGLWRTAFTNPYVNEVLANMREIERSLGVRYSRRVERIRGDFIDCRRN